MKTFCSIIVISAMCMAVAVAQPGRGDGPGPKPGGPGGGPSWSRMADERDLTASQQKELRKLQHDFRNQMIDLRAQAEKARLHVRSLMGEDTVDRAAIIKAVEDEGAAEIAIKKSRVEHILKVREIVGPEKAMEMMDQWREQRGGGKMGPPKDREKNGLRD